MFVIYLSDDNENCETKTGINNNRRHSRTADPHTGRFMSIFYKPLSFWTGTAFPWFRS